MHTYTTDIMYIYTCTTESLVRLGTEGCARLRRLGEFPAHSAHEKHVYILCTYIYICTRRHIYSRER